MPNKGVVGFAARPPLWIVAMVPVRGEKEYWHFGHYKTHADALSHARDWSGGMEIVSCRMAEPDEIRIARKGDLICSGEKLAAIDVRRRIEKMLQDDEKGRSQCNLKHKYGKCK